MAPSKVQLRLFFIMRPGEGPMAFRERHGGVRTPPAFTRVKRGISVSWALEGLLDSILIASPNCLSNHEKFRRHLRRLREYLRWCFRHETSDTEERDAPASDSLKKEHSYLLAKVDRDHTLS